MKKVKEARILVLLLILISSFFILNYLDEINIIEITSKTVLDTKATLVALGLAVSVDADPPKIYIDSPKNITYNFNNSIRLNFTVVETNLDKIYYNIDNGENITITSNITFSVNLTNSHILKLFANDSVGRLNSSSVTFSINISKPWNVTFSKFIGATTNFLSYNTTQLSNLSNVMLENPNHGFINFIQSINISNDINLDSYINISFNRIELQSEFLREFNKSATLRFYNLTFTNPRILFNNEVCPNSICTKNSYSNGILSFNVTGFSTYSTEETSSGSGSPGSSSNGGSGGGGGGGSGKAVFQDNFNINTDLIKIELLQGETKKQNLEIENIGSQTLDLTLNLEDIEDILIFPGGTSKFEFRLKPHEKQIVQLIFNAAKNHKPGVYPGKIIVSSQSFQKIITTIVEVESIKKIFDVNVNLLNKEVIKGTNLIAEISLFNLGTEKERVDTQVEYGIKNLNGDIIQKDGVRIAVETQASFVEEIYIPTDLPDGRYVFYAEVHLGNEIGTASEIFKVITGKDEVLSLSSFYIYIYPPIIILLILFIFEYFKHHIKFTRKKEESSDKKLRITKEFSLDENLEEKFDRIKRDYELGIISKAEYSRLKKKIEDKLKR